MRRMVKNFTLYLLQVGIQKKKYPFYGLFLWRNIVILYSSVKRLTKTENGKVIIPEDVFKFLITSYLKTVPFDEAAYLRANPDVDAAIHRGELKSGHDHFIQVGFFEGRDTDGKEFDEKWYLKNNPDVAASVLRGEWTNGKMHWLNVGRAELRAPSKALEPVYDTWRGFCAA